VAQAGKIHRNDPTWRKPWIDIQHFLMHICTFTDLKKNLIKKKNFVTAKRNYILKIWEQK
jgi:hypothetical protein